MKSDNIYKYLSKRKIKNEAKTESLQRPMTILLHLIFLIDNRVAVFIWQKFIFQLPRTEISTTYSRMNTDINIFIEDYKFPLLENQKLNG